MVIVNEGRREREAKQGGLVSHAVHMQRNLDQVPGSGLKADSVAVIVSVVVSKELADTVIAEWIVDVAASKV